MSNLSEAYRRTSYISTSDLWDRGPERSAESDCTELPAEAPERSELRSRGGRAGPGPATGALSSQSYEGSSSSQGPAHSVYPSTRMQQKSAGEMISQQVVHQPRRLSRPFFLRMALS